MHFRRGNVVVFQGKGNILTDGEAYKLGVRVLQYGTNFFGKLKNILFFGFIAFDFQTTLNFATVGKGNEPI